MEEKEIRRKLGSLLRGQAEFLKIREDSKVPVGSFKPGRRNRYKRLPQEGNYGILPMGPLVILDVDVHKGGSLEEQVPLFSDLLGVPLEETFSVTSPSGGKHFYLNLPSSAVAGAASLPKTSLRSFQSIIREMTDRPLALVDADLRSDAANAYVLGPGSRVKGKTYVADELKPILTMSEEGYSNLLSLPRLRDEAREQGKAAIDIWAGDPGNLPPAVMGESLGLGRVPSASIRKLERALLHRTDFPYHQRRAFLKAALHCCYSSDAIAEVCMALAVNRDSATDKAIPRSTLLKDLNSFTPQARFHGPYCPVGQAQQKERRREKHPALVLTLEEGLARRQAKIDKLRGLPEKVAFHAVNPRVLDVEKIGRSLQTVSKRGPKAQQYRHALAIVESVLQPLANVGAEKFILGKAFLKETLDLTDSQVSTALRLLRTAGILEVRDKQAQGFIPTYVVHPTFVHRKLSFHLRRTWVARREEGLSGPLHFSAREGGFREAVSREPAFTNSLAAHLAKAQAEVFEATETEPSLAALRAYLKIDLPVEQ